MIPAYNEERGIARLLDALCRNGGNDELDIIVVCNGCTDRTAAIAFDYGPGVTVIETEIASKRHAMDLGSDAALFDRRIFVDADIVIDGASIQALLRALDESSVLAAAPVRVMPMRGVSLLVRSYYKVWLSLPQTIEGLYGRGVIALAGSGLQRYRALPSLMSDDLVLSDAFEPAERRVVTDAHVLILPPRRFMDLLRRRIRIVTGIHQADVLHARDDRSRTTVSTLLGVLRRAPRTALHLPVFLLVTVLSRICAHRAIRSGDFTSWHRDESSRA